MAVIRTGGSCLPGLTRRDFVRSAAASAVVGSALLKAPHLFASPLGLPLGLQLYSVREQLAKDYEGTLKQLSAIGYKEVEAAGFYGKSADEVKQAMQSAGLHCVSAHYSYNDLNRDIDAAIAYNKTLGVEYIICSFPGFKDPTHSPGKAFTLEDFRWNAERFNHFGEKIKAGGLRFGYHNHTMEFHAEGGVVPFDELVRLTDPSLVTFEMDCGWVMVGGGDPVAYLHKYPTRISMLHIKDFKPAQKGASSAEPPPSAPLGQGTMDYRPIFEAAKKASIKHYFVEQEGYDMAPMDELRVDADYVNGLKV
jgi:sugar phosphate isomerase/epimerase